MHLPTLALAAALVSQVAGHGYVQQILVQSTGQYIETWNPYKDPQKNIEKITRKFKDNGPVTDNLFETDAITCNIGKDNIHNVPVNKTAAIPAGAKITFLWTDWQSDHPGPSKYAKIAPNTLVRLSLLVVFCLVMTWLARCPGKCKDFKGNTGNVWVKIHQAGYDASLNPPWASKRLPTQNSTWPVTLPSTIEPGEYLLRHEILGLQRTNTNGSLAQFYPACHQITITGSGKTKLPTGVALPGAFKRNDPGIFNPGLGANYG
ncbi:Endoglucanase-4 [Dactylellina cionopaga]|nr:Endoglucanase-4 [Dactylellina cionopaga]